MVGKMPSVCPEGSLPPAGCSSLSGLCSYGALSPEPPSLGHIFLVLSDSAPPAAAPGTLLQVSVLAWAR